MASPSWFCGVGERDRFRRMGEQAGVLRLELLAVLEAIRNVAECSAENSFIHALGSGGGDGEQGP